MLRVVSPVVILALFLLTSAASAQYDPVPGPSP